MVSFYVSTATFFLLHCDEWDRVVTLPRHKFVTGATLLQLVCDQKKKQKQKQNKKQKQNNVNKISQFIMNKLRDFCPQLLLLMTLFSFPG
jgi:flagellar biosynthesis protein FliP